MNPMHLLKHALYAATAVVALTASTSRAADATMTEVQLPTFQQAAMAADEPIRDLLLNAPDAQNAGNVLWLLGKTSLWRWDIEAKGLKRLKLGDPAIASADNLKHLGTDGVSLFAAGDGALYQVPWQQARVFRYPLRPKAPALSFAGFADDFWYVNGAAVFLFDRYGKTLQPKSGSLRLTPDDLTLFDPRTRTLWIARKTKLIRASLKDATQEVTLTATHPLLGIAKSGADLVLHTAHAVLRVGANGKLNGSIPVEGRRKLLAMSVNGDAHSYLFSDDLLEIYGVKNQSVRRFAVSLEGVTSTGSLTTAGRYVALLADGRPRLYLLPAP